MNYKKLKQKATEIMNEDPDQTMPPEFKHCLVNMKFKITNNYKKSGDLADIYSDEIDSANSLVTIMNRPETKNENNKQTKEDALFRLNNPSPPQCKKLFKYEGSWDNVKESSDYKFVKYLELIIKDDGYVLQSRFD